MTTVAVVAHRKKTIGGGLAELRTALGGRGVDAPVWYEIDKSRKATKKAAKAAADGADVVFVWGGDGTVQRCVDALAGTGVALAIIPAGTANLLATNLGVPKDLDGAVDVGLHGTRRPLDVGRVNGERFAVMAGAGFDAAMIRDADGAMKDRRRPPGLRLDRRASAAPAGAAHHGRRRRRTVVQRRDDVRARRQRRHDHRRRHRLPRRRARRRPSRRRRRHRGRARAVGAGPRPDGDGQGPPVAARRDHARAPPSTSGSSARRSTSSTAATGRRPSGWRSASSRRRSASACPGRGMP